MTDSSLSQTEADALLAMKKHCTDTTECAFPGPGRRVVVSLVSTNRWERFFLDSICGGRDRSRQGHLSEPRAPGRDPSTARFRRRTASQPQRRRNWFTHRHLYRKGFGDRWAIPAPLDRFSNLQDPLLTLGEFMLFCNVVEPPVIQRGLFA